LEVRADATFEEIEASYRGMLAYLSADSLAMYSMMEDEDLARVRAQVDEAYQALRDPERRAAYDRSIGRSSSSYPTVMVPHDPSDSHVSLGHVVASASPSSTAAVAPAPPVPPQPASAPVVEVKAPAVTSSPAVPVAAAATPVATTPVVPPAPVEAANAAPVRARPADASHRLTPIPPAARIFEAGAPAVISRASGSPLAAITKRPTGPAAGVRAVRHLVPKPDFEITAETEYSGALLRRLRESCNATLEDMSEITKVSKRYLRALEDSDFESLPAPVYVRGFVAEYSRALGLDTVIVCKSYMAIYHRHKGEGG
jgi:hypothetical protein